MDKIKTKRQCATRTALLMLVYGLLGDLQVAAQILWEPTGASGGRIIYSLAVDASGRIFAGTDSGVYRSTDKDEQWKRVLTIPRVLCLAISANSHVFAGTGDSGMFRSINNGDQWEPVNSGFRQPELDLLSLAITARGDIFTGTEGDWIYRSTDNGNNWVRINKGLEDSNILALVVVRKTNEYILAGTRNSGVFQSTDNGNSWSTRGLTNIATRVLAANASGHVFAGTVEHGTFRSIDDGSNWSLINIGQTNESTRVFANTAHGAIFAGTSKGVFCSNTNGNSWTRVDSGLTNTFVRSLAVHPDGHVFAGTNGGGVFRSIDAAAPTIVHTPVLHHLHNEPLALEAQISDDVVVAAATLSFRPGGAENFHTVPIGPADARGIYAKTIPADSITARGLEYFITAIDSFCNTTRLPDSGYYSVSVQVNNEAKPIPQPNGSDQIAYRLASVPLEVADRTARAIFEDDLGVYDNTKWRCYTLPDGTGLYEEFSDTLTLKPGQAVWLIIKEPDKVVDTGPAVSIKTDCEYAIPLHAKWNFVSTPFNFRIPLKNLRLKSGKDVVLRSYIGNWNDTEEFLVAGMKPFEGYAIFSDSCVVDTLLVNPDLFSASTTLSKQTHDDTENFAWSIRILAQCQEARDRDNVAAVSAKSSGTHDQLDQPEPPNIGEHVSVYFPHREWRTLAKTFCIDARPEPTEGEIWDFEVKTNIRDKVYLTFEGIESVPTEFEVHLTDDALLITQNLRETNAYTIAGSEHPKRLKLVVGRKDFMIRELAQAQLIPANYELSQNYPNPFNPVTTIRYGLPESGRVSLKIYNLLGEEVVTLVEDEQKAAGYHVAIWDGKDRNSVYTASGVYVYCMRAGGFVLTKKLALVK